MLPEDILITTKPLLQAALFFALADMVFVPLLVLAHPAGSVLSSQMDPHPYDGHHLVRNLGLGNQQFLGDDLQLHFSSLGTFFNTDLHIRRS